MAKSWLFLHAKTSLSGPVKGCKLALKELHGLPGTILHFIKNSIIDRGRFNGLIYEGAHLFDCSLYMPNRLSSKAMHFIFSFFSLQSGAHKLEVCV